MASCENLLDDTNINSQQFKAITSTKSHHHHVTRKTGTSIFSNPFKNGIYRFDLILRSSLLILIIINSIDLFF